MTRPIEAALLGGATALAAIGVALVDLAADRTPGAQVALTGVVFVIAFGAVHWALSRWMPGASQLLFPVAAFLTAVGFTEIYRLDPELAGLQRWWLLYGAAAAVGVLWWLSARGTQVIRRYRNLFLIGALILFLLPLLPSVSPLGGVEVSGSRLWVRLRVLGNDLVQVQPGELGKLLLVAFLASYLAERRTALATMTRRIGGLAAPEPRQLAPIAIAWAGSLAVLVYERDLGASLLLVAVVATMLYAATNRAAYLVAGGALFAAGAVAATALFDHAQRRVDAWLRPWEDFADAGFQTAQGLFAMGSGSLTGSGLGLGEPYLIPSASTDFIFAAVAEELGLAGAVAVVTAYALLLAAGFGIALRARDPFRKLLAAGLTLTLGLQTVLIIGGVVRLVPVTGVTLPFMSYGGSSLVANLIALAVLATVSWEASERT